MAVPETPDDYIAELREKFGWVDYLVFALVLLTSAGIGIFYGFFSKRKQNNEEFLMGGRSMAAWPVALSIMCSFVSALTVLGNPVEVYQYGTQYITIILIYVPVTLALRYIYVPVYFQLQLTSAYEYFEIRFNTLTRLILSLIHCIYLVFYMALVVYGPSLALNQVTGFNTLLSVAIIFVICMFYSTLGGFRAVIYTDAMQAIIMIVSMAVLAIKGTADAGGFGAIWDKLDATDRIHFFRFDPDPRTRHSVWAVCVGGAFLYLNMLGGSQANIQRYSSMPDMKTVNRALWLNCLALTIIILLCTYTGVVVFARFYDCDPIAAKLVETTDQILPLFVMDNVGHIPGLPGLFVAGITCASLSTVSSGLNAMAAIVVKDYALKFRPNMSDTLVFNLSRITNVVTGLISFAFIFVVRQMGDIFPAAVSMIGILIGPTLGLFSLGMMFPQANGMGALIGCLASYAFSLFIGIGSSISGGNEDLPNQKCSVSTANCSEFFTDFSSIKNVTHLESPAAIWKDLEFSGYIRFMSISYLFFPLIGFLGTIVFGLICSGVITLFGLEKEKKLVRSDCMSPPFLRFWRWLLPEQMAEMISDVDGEKERNTLESRPYPEREIETSDHGSKKPSLVDINSNKPDDGDKESCTHESKKPSLVDINSNSPEEISKF